MKDDFTDDMGWTYTTPFMATFESRSESFAKLLNCKHAYKDDMPVTSDGQHQMTIQTCSICGAKRGKYKK